MAENDITLRVVLVAAVLAVVMVALAFLPKPTPAPVSTVDAEVLTLNDARLAYPSAEVSVLESRALAEGHWRVRVKVSLNSHSICPRVLVREYELLPILFREEEVVKDCRVGVGPLVYEEETLLKSLDARRARDAAEKGQYGCAVKLADLPKLSGTCAQALPTLQAFVPRLPPGSWLVAWLPRPTPPGDEFISVGLDHSGRILFVERVPGTA